MRSVRPWVGMCLLAITAGCDAWPTTPRAGSDASADVGTVPDDRVVVVDDAGASPDDVSTDDVVATDDRGVATDDRGVATDVVAIDAGDAGTIVDVVRDAGVDVPTVVDAGTPTGLRVREMGIVTVGPSTGATSGTLQVRDMGFEYGERQCSTGGTPVCWIGGIVP